MDETPVQPCHTAANPEGGSEEYIPDKDWDQFDGCEQCHGRAPIEETPDGDLICQICRAKLPRPST